MSACHALKFLSEARPIARAENSVSHLGEVPCKTISPQSDKSFPLSLLCFCSTSEAQSLTSSGLCFLCLCVCVCVEGGNKQQLVPPEVLQQWRTLLGCHSCCCSRGWGGSRRCLVQFPVLPQSQAQPARDRHNSFLGPVLVLHHPGRAWGEARRAEFKNSFQNPLLPEKMSCG